MQLCSELANDGSGEVFRRFEISCNWAILARANRHPSASTAHETAMSLLQETLDSCPTLQIQHHRLSLASRDAGTFPSHYASYQIENGQVEQAIETLERGRALIWSEMRGLRTSTDRLRAADPAIADKFANRHCDAKDAIKPKYCNVTNASSSSLSLIPFPFFRGLQISMAMDHRRCSRFSTYRDGDRELGISVEETSLLEPELDDWDHW